LFYKDSSEELDRHFTKQIPSLEKEKK